MAKMLTDWRNGTESHDSAEAVPEHSQKTLGRRSLVAKLLRGKLWRRTDCRYPPVHRTAADASLNVKRALLVSALSFPALKDGV